MLEGEERDRALTDFKKEFGAVGYLVVSFLGRLKGMPRMDGVVSRSPAPRGAAEPE